MFPNAKKRVNAFARAKIYVKKKTKAAQVEDSYLKIKEKTTTTLNSVSQTTSTSAS